MSSISKKQQAIIYIICSAFFFALMNMFVRMSGDLPSIQKSFFRNLVAFFFALIILLRSKEGFSFQKKNLPAFIGRSFFGTPGILCNFYAVDHLVLSDASILNKLSPFFAILFSYFILKEKLTLVQGCRSGLYAGAGAGTAWRTRPVYRPVLFGLFLPHHTAVSDL